MWKPDHEPATAWERRIGDCLPLLGHRNWIVVADSAYPAHAQPGIETQIADADHLRVVKRVLDGISASRHLRPKVYVDRELSFVSETDAPGVADYRRELEALLGHTGVDRLPHEQIIHKLDQSAQLFRILIVKTDMTIPYTSVFFELNCGYWNPEAEQRLRQAIRVAESA